MADGKRSSARQDLNIVDDGDVILVIGAETFLRVSSFVLVNTSSVFKAMLSPKFREGWHVRSTEYPQEIPLPDDDPNPMLVVCPVLHAQDTNALLQSTTGPTPALVLDLAIVADKYACIAPVYFMGEALIHRCADHLAGSSNVTACFPEAQASLAAAAYLLKLPKSFALSTRRLVLDTTVPFSSLLYHRSVKLLTPYLLLALEEQRGAARNHVVDEINAKLATSAQNTQPRRSKKVNSMLMSLLIAASTAAGRHPEALSLCELCCRRSFRCRKFQSTANSVAAAW
ncbi:hypothetical protein LTR29_018175 [Friedmanniomyces endolithicus]|nr:hypothetical protein LTR29_018175 [Friedmanniomyces endolithicus]